MSRVRLAQIGIGYWGKNLLRNFLTLPDAEVVVACDLNADIRAEAVRNHPGLHVTDRVEELFEDESIDGVVVATQTDAHVQLAEAALLAGKHVFVEKPMAHTVEQAERLVALAESSGKHLMVGHLLRYHPAFELVREMIDKGELGEIHYIHTTRVNLGIVRDHENAFDSLAPHDLATALSFLQSDPVSVSATGAAFLRPDIHDVVFATVEFENNRLAHLHTSWLDPDKVRRVTVVGSRKMAVIDDVEAVDKVRVYDKGVTLTPETGYPPYAEAMKLRFGEVVVPQIPAIEPLRAECAHFVECIKTGNPPRTDGQEGLVVTKLLAAARESLTSGKTVSLR